MFHKPIRLLLFVLLFLNCSEFFFPKTGFPDNSSAQRSTPEGVLKQLIEAYESRRIDLIDDLLADSFQFYVAKTFDEYYTLDYDSEPPDSTMQYLKRFDKPFYNYWKRKDELNRTKKLFEHTITTIFYEQPNFSLPRYEVTSTRDTLFVEIQLIGGDLFLETDNQGYQRVDITNQIFKLIRDSEGLWVIRKWYDLSTESSTI